VPLPERRWCFVLLLALCVVAQASERTVEVAPGDIVRYRVVDSATPSARPTAERLLRLLAAGELEAAAQLSNAPQRRLEELESYRTRVGAEEFKRVFGQYLAPENRLVAEIAIDQHRLLVWELADAGKRLAGQFYVEVDGKFLMDDVPNATRLRLRRVLDAYRSGKVRISE
jgi:hypothetical protein